MERARRRREGLLWIGVLLVGMVALANTAVLATSASSLSASDVLLLVNADSPVSCSIANLYRRYYPSITDEQVLYLAGLPDCASTSAGPADEIITRQQYETLIAQPVRDYLVANDMVDSVYCLITTAGMPYRIEDTNAALDAVVGPASSNPILVVNNLATIDAASVESELAVLFQGDPALDLAVMMPRQTRVVNPYQGYHSGIKAWAATRDILARRTQLAWTYMWRVTNSPKIEGRRDNGGYSAKLRFMAPADLYLVARLDGPRNEGEYPIFAVKRMLDRSAMVSDPASPQFVGYDPDSAWTVIDGWHDNAMNLIAFSRIYNFPSQYEFLCFEDSPVPPGAEEYISGFNEAHHYQRAYSLLTGDPAPPLDVMQATTIVPGLQGQLLWDDTQAVMNSTPLPSGSGLLALLTYGRNGGDGRAADYLLTGGPGGGPLFECVPGAVFSSLESYNALTMFTNPSTTQAKIAEFIAIGGSGAMGHAFEPVSDALVQGDFLLRNLIRDEDSDGVADLSWVEAASTALPYLSWAEVIIGDPLMRLRVGPGGLVSIMECPYDVNGDGWVNYPDFVQVYTAYNSIIGDPAYNPAADVNRDGCVGYNDFVGVYTHYNTACP